MEIVSGLFRFRSV